MCQASDGVKKKMRLIRIFQVDILAGMVPQYLWEKALHTNETAIELHKFYNKI